MSNELERKPPRQSEVLGRFIDAQWFKEVDRERGAAVHRAINVYIRGLFVPNLLQHQGYFESFDAWHKSMVKEVRYAEGWVYEDGIWVWRGPLLSKLGYTGLPDFIGILTGETELSIVDWKTSVSVSKFWQLQVSGAYRMAAEDNGYKIGRCLALRLDKDGGQAHVTEYGSRMDIAWFCKFLDAWRFLYGS